MPTVRRGLVRARPVGLRVPALACVLCGLLLVAGGALIAVRALHRDAAPGRVVRAYFAALARADAPTALGLGGVPPGDPHLLTSVVLAEQQRLAPMRDIVVGAPVRVGAVLRVPVSYRLAFPAGAQHVHTDVTVHEVRGSWRLTAAAANTLLGVDTATQRVSVLGGALPARPVLLFPGAIPVSTDTPYLQLDPARAHSELAAPLRTAAHVGVSATGREAAQARVLSALRACLRPARRHDAPATCPLPPGRFVPGSLRGTVHSWTLSVALQPGAAGVLRTTGSADVDASVHRLTFTNGWVTSRERLSLALHAQAYAVAPLTTVWTHS